MIGLKRAAVAVVVSASACAHAADPRTLDCVVAGLSPADRASIVAAARKLETSDDAPITPRAKAAIQAAATRCAAIHHWSAAATDAAQLFVYPALSQGPVNDAIRATGNDPVRWAQIFHTMPEQDRVAAVLDPKSMSSKLVDRLLAAKINLFGGNAARLAGVQATMLETLDLTRQRFAEQ